MKETTIKFTMEETIEYDHFIEALENITAMYNIDMEMLECQDTTS